MIANSTFIQEIRTYARRLVREWNLLEGAFLDTGYNYSQCHALFEISKSSVVNTMQLSKSLLLDKSTTSRLLTNLLNKGLVKVQKDTADRRQKWYSLTEEGQEVLARNNCLADGQVINALVLLSDYDVAIL